MTVLIILAAGESRRLGHPKQNLLFQNKTLLQRAVETGLDSKCRPVIVVLGANADLITPIVFTEGVRIIHNEDWEEGIASSIRIAINEVQQDNSINGALIMLCDQPFVDADLLNNMLQKKMDTRSVVVACNYNNTIGVPALFDRALFAGLLLLVGNEGAKKVIKDHIGDVVMIPFEAGGVDIDTEEDYQRLID